MTPLVRLWVFRGLFIILALVAISVPLLPLRFSPDRLPMPDLFFALTIAWVVREPQTAPLVLIAGLALLADAVLMRPLGLWAVLIVFASELARMNARLIREGGILTEMIFFALIIIAMFFIQNIMLFITFLGGYPVNTLAWIILLSLIAYPLFALFLHYVIRVRGLDLKNRPDRLGKVG